MISAPKNATPKAKWMPCPKIEAEYPGLTYFHPLEELIIVKETDALHELIAGDHIDYTIYNNEGEKVFLAVQTKRWKKFDIKIFNYYGNEVMQVRRPFQLFLNRVLVWAPPGNYVGSVHEICSCINTFVVKNNGDEVVLKIKARGFFHFVYKIMSNEREVGEIADNVKSFGVSFPAEMVVRDKVILLGACFLIDIGFYAFPRRLQTFPATYKRLSKTT